MAKAKPIVIVTTPRTGSNTLMFSLAAHPNAVCGGELFNDVEEANFEEYWKNKTKHLDKCTLYKVMYHDRGHPNFDSCMQNRFVIYLYRKDRAAQLESWERACETGKWLDGYPATTPSQFPWNANQQINEAESYFRPRADLILETQDMLTLWPVKSALILTLANWTTKTLERITHPKQAK